ATACSAACSGGRTCTAGPTSRPPRVWWRGARRASASSSRACAPSCARPSSSGPTRGGGTPAPPAPAGPPRLRAPPPRATARGAGPEYPIEAIPPTVLHLLGVAVPEDFEAPVMTAALRPEFLSAHPVRSQPAVGDAAAESAGWRSSEDEAHVAEHLRALGY